MPYMEHRGEEESASWELEKVLSDTNLGCFHRYTKATWMELKLLFKLAAPAVMVYVINNSMSLSTRIFSGHLSNLDFAAASLANSGIQLFAYGLLVSTSYSLHRYRPQLIYPSLAARNGERRRNPLRTGLRRTPLRHARRVPPTRHRGADALLPSDRGGLLVLQATAGIHRRTGDGGGACVGVRVRLNPAGIRVRGEFSDSEISSGAEYSGAQRDDISGDAGGAYCGKLGGGVQDGFEVARGIAVFEHVVVDYCNGAVCVYREKRKV